ncbi:MAG: NAD(P)-dependent oxidoreductase [Planctomycetia bacterium]|nr:NAD(P)-dependent oxidoreductase [Planctomycetia bacterium]
MNIGWIGTGIMGAAMCGRLLENGYACTVFNRTRQRAETLLQKGATWADSPREVAGKCGIVFTMVGYPQDVEEVILHPETGVLQGFRENQASEKIVVDMTTSRPSLAVAIAEKAVADHVFSLDAPVSGGDLGAVSGTLSIMVGGERKIFEKLMPIWNILGKTILFQGKPGSGQHTKMVNQILIAGNMLGMCEALRYGQAVGLDLEKVLASVSTGAAGSWSLSHLAPRILRNDFAPGFKIRHFVKDLKIALEEAKAASLSLATVALATQLYEHLVQAGYAEEGTQALFLEGR